MTAPPIDDSPRPPSYRDLLIARAGRPRATRPTVRGMAFFLVSIGSISVVAGVLGQYIWQKWAASKSFALFEPLDWFRLIVMAFFTLMAIFVFRFRHRDRELVRNGEVAVASVLRQEMRPRIGSRLTYSFEDARGIKCQGICLDRTKSLFKGMSFLVFYERDRPRQRIASCESAFEVVLPNEN